MLTEYDPKEMYLILKSTMISLLSLYVAGLAISHCPTARGKLNCKSGK